MYEDLARRLNAYSAEHEHHGGITAEAADAIEGLQKAVYFHKYNSEFWEDKYNSLADEKWIPVTEKPPLKVGDDGYNGYLVLANGFCEVADYTVDESGVLCFFVDGEYEPDVTHFVPIPELPKLDGGRGNV